MGSTRSTIFHIAPQGNIVTDPWDTFPIFRGHNFSFRGARAVLITSRGFIEICGEGRVGVTDSMASLAVT